METDSEGDRVDCRRSIRRLWVDDAVAHSSRHEDRVGLTRNGEQGSGAGDDGAAVSSWRKRKSTLAARDRFLHVEDDDLGLNEYMLEGNFLARKTATLMSVWIFVS